MPQFLGKIIFLENYDMRLGRRLVSGVDIWMNTPTRPLEASGTSGQKAELNGTLNLSVLDGWWLEGYRENAGWALTDKRTYDNQHYQDELDAATIYSILENEVIPTYYNINKKGYSEEWVKFIKKSISEIAPVYTTKRMLDDYLDRFYMKQFKRSVKLKANRFKLATELAEWKSVISENWDKIDVISISDPMSNGSRVAAGADYAVEVNLNIGILKGSDVGVEVVKVAVDENNSEYISNKVELLPTKEEGSVITYSGVSRISEPGSYKMGIRIYPNHKELPHRQDFCYVRWI